MMITETYHKLDQCVIKYLWCSLIGTKSTESHDTNCKLDCEVALAGLGLFWVLT